jgi:hypothetical protein
MATGDQADFQSRIKGLLPAGWFPVTGETDTSSASPILDALISGAAAQGAAIWTQQQYVLAQTRIATATGIQLDIIALDYLGPTFVRRDTDTDASFRARIQAQLLAPRGTRESIVLAIQNLCGTTPITIEPGNVQDTGGWDTCALAWDTAGCWGNYSMAFEVFVTVEYNPSVGVPYVAGWDTSAGGWDSSGNLVWVDDSMISNTVTTADIYATIAECLPVCGIAWVKIVSPTSGSVDTTGAFNEAFTADFA